MSDDDWTVDKGISDLRNDYRQVFYIPPDLVWAAAVFLAFVFGVLVGVLGW